MWLTLYATGVSLKLENFQWFTTKVEYPDHTITSYRLEITQTHTKKLRDMKHPGMFTDHCSFLGMCYVYRQFVADYFRIATLLGRLFKKR